jgi:TrmH family RNA methyltransferase
LLDEARRSLCEIGAVFVREPAMALESDAPVYVVTASVFDQLSTTEASQGIVSLVRPPRWTLDLAMPVRGLSLVLDGVQEPGNAGAIVRTAEAFGASGVVFLKGTASPFNPKTLRASAGSLFRLPFVSGVSDDSFRNTLHQNGIRLYAALPDAAGALPDTDLRGGCAILIGGEGRGVRPEWRGKAAGIRIPTDAVESLNAAVAAAVILYEARRQRTLP